MLANVQSGIGEQAGDFLVREAEAAMRVALAQMLFLVRREIDDDQASAGSQRPRGLAQRAGRIVEIMQNLMHDRQVGGVAFHRQRVDVALPQLRVAHAGAIEIGARDGQHSDGLDSPPIRHDRPPEFRERGGSRSYTCR